MTSSRHFSELMISAAGIAVVIASLQINDFLGLSTGEMPQHFLEKMLILLQALPTTHWPDMLIGILTLSVLLFWSRLKSRIPGHLIALLIGSVAAWLLTMLWPTFNVATINSQFSFMLDGVQQQGIPQTPPLPLLPWSLPDSSGQPIGISWQLVRDLLPSAFTVAMLGAIESLLCAVVADGLTGAGISEQPAVLEFHTGLDKVRQRILSLRSEMQN